MYFIILEKSCKISSPINYLKKLTNYETCDCFASVTDFLRCFYPLLLTAAATAAAANLVFVTTPTTAAATVTSSAVAVSFSILFHGTQVKDGRWGHMAVPVVPLTYRDALGADVFGRTRSPWNVNDRKYLTRGLGEMCGLTTTDFCECFSFFFLLFVLTVLYSSTLSFFWS